jgi:aromatic-L-amino-acid decarboxylase
MAADGAGWRWSPEEFRRRGYEAVDWVARYMEEVESYPVLSQVEPGSIRAGLPPDAPEQPEPFDAILADLDRIVMPGITHWQSPNFFAYFPGNASGPSVLGELVAAGLGVQGMLWATSPACTEVEAHVLDWMVDLLALPEPFRSTSTGGGVIQDSASSATLCAVLAARERATAGDAGRDGVRQPLTAYTSTQGHSSIEKAVRIAGLGDANLRLIDVDGSFAMRADLLEAAIVADKEAGLRPCVVTATVGTTSSTAVDPVAAIGDVCRRHDVWLHVDSAFAGPAAICAELRFVNDGLDRADSYCFNPHKWLLTNFDCDCFYVADRAALLQALSILPEYLRNAARDSGAVIDYRDWHVPLGRRFRALKLWFVLRSFGAEGLRAHVRSGVALARSLADRVEADPDFELAAPVPLSLVCLRHAGGDDINQRILDTVNSSGRAYLTHTKLDGKLTVRVAIGGAGTDERHVDQLWDLIRAAAAGAG